MHKAFSGELTKVWREENGVEFEWEEKTLGESEIQIIDGDRGKAYPKKEEFTQNGFCLFLNAKNVTKNGFKFEINEFISKERDELLRKGKLERNDIVLTTRGTLGNIALYDMNIPYNHVRINSGMVIFRLDSTLKHEFFIYLFFSNYIQNQILKIKSGSAQPQLPIKDMKNITIKTPSLPEQEEIVRILDDLLGKEQESKELLNLLVKIDLMKKAILGRAFRGELGTNRAEEESAETLLKEVLSSQ